jgi:cell division protein FtsB
MSQAKVDHYKQKKQNRETEKKQEKIKSYLSRAFVAIFCLAFVFWLGYSIYFSIKGPVRSRTVVNTTAVDNYINDLNETGETEIE